MNAAPLNSLCTASDRVMVTYRLVNGAGRYLARPVTPTAVRFTAHENDAAEFESGPRALEVRDVLAAMSNEIMASVLRSCSVESVRYPHADGTPLWNAAVRVKETALQVVLLMLEGCPPWMAKGGPSC